MAHYERLANGKYAYTTTIQVISNEEFTNPNRSIYQGCLRASINHSSTPNDREKANKYMVFLSGISNSAYGVTSSNCGITTTSITLSTSNPPILTTKVIDGKTYYGIEVYDSLGFIFNLGSRNEQNYHRFFSAKTTEVLIKIVTCDSISALFFKDFLWTNKLLHKNFWKKKILIPEQELIQALWGKLLQFCFVYGSDFSFISVQLE